MKSINSLLGKSLVITCFMVISIFRLYAAIPISSPVNYIPQAFDVLNYTALLDFSKAPSTEMTGICTIKIVWIEKPDTNVFYFHIEGLNFDSAFYNGSRTIVNFIDKSGGTSYSSIEPLNSSHGDTALVTIYYHGAMTNADGFGGVHSEKGILYSVGVGFNNESVSATRHWLTCYDHPSDKATIDFTFVTPENQIVASNGMKVQDSVIDGLRRTRWISNNQVATNLMTFAVSDFIVVNDIYKNIPIVIYTRKSDSVASVSTYRKVDDMLRTMEARYGTYPFEKAGYVNTPLSGGAMEHQTMITMNEAEIRQMFAVKDSLNETAAHELAHQWFGNSVTPFDYRDAWFNEGFATFAAAVWFEDVVNYSKYLYRVSYCDDYYINYYSKAESVFPLYDYPRGAPSSNYPTTIYFKGCGVLAMLRYELGDELFFNTVKSFLAEYKNITTKDIQKYFEIKTGRDLDWFFTQWIYGKGYPVLNIRINRTKSNNDGYCNADIDIAQTQPDDWGVYKNLPVEFDFAGLDGKKKNIVLMLNNKHEKFTLDSLPDFVIPVINRGQIVRSLIKVDELTSGVETNDSEQVDIDIHPNPAKGKITITNKYGYLFSKIILSDLSGNEIDIDAPKIINSGSDFDLNVTGLADGVYYLTFFTKDFVKTFSFIIKN